MFKSWRLDVFVGMRGIFKEKCNSETLIPSQPWPIDPINGLLMPRSILWGGSRINFWKMPTPTPVPRYKRGHPDILVPIEKINFWTDRIIQIELADQISRNIFIFSFFLFCCGWWLEPGYQGWPNPHSAEVLSRNFRLNSSILNQPENSWLALDSQQWQLMNI